MTTIHTTASQKSILQQIAGSKSHNSSVNPESLSLKKIELTESRIKHSRLDDSKNLIEKSLDQAKRTGLTALSQSHITRQSHAPSIISSRRNEETSFSGSRKSSIAKSVKMFEEDDSDSQKTTSRSDFDAKKSMKNSAKEWEKYLRQELIDNDNKNLQVQYLLYVPKDQRSVQTDEDEIEKRPFYSFKDLRAKAEGAQKEILKNIKQYDNIQAKMRKTMSKDQLHTVVSLLQFNKIQKKSYRHEVSTARDSLISSLIHKEDEETSKRRQMPPIRAYTLLNHIGPKIPQNALQVDEPETVKAVLFTDETHPGQPLIDEVGKEVETNEAIVSYIYKFNWKFRVRDKGELRPIIREGHTLSLVGKKLVLYGGFNNTCFQETFIFDPSMQRWMKPEVTGEVPLEGRHGHSACVYKKSLVIFGGQKDYHHELRYRECLNEVRIFSAYKNSWEKLKTRGPTIEPRRNHASAIYDRVMYIYGGINTEGQYLRDLWSLNLKNNQWQKLIIENNRDPGVAFHTMVPCFEARELRAYKEGDLNSKVIEEGIYVFGGKNADGEALDTLKILTLTKTGAMWKYPSVKGKFPAPRYGHTMLVYDTLGLIIVYGGRNDQLLNSGDCANFNQISVLSLELMAWMAVSNTGSTLSMPRYHHAAAIVGDSMVIFGGLEPEGYATDDVATTEISQVEFSRVQKFQKDSKEANSKKKKKHHQKDEKALKKRGMSEPHLGNTFSDLTDSGIIRQRPPLAPAKSFSEPRHQKNLLSYLPIPRPEKLKEKYNISRSQSVIKRVIVEARSFVTSRERSLEVKKVGF